jgi:hypothetical protein
MCRWLDHRCRFTGKAAWHLYDPHESRQAKHDLLTPVQQHLLTNTQSYEDNNDAATLTGTRFSRYWPTSSGE